jgi:hypothetical protein
MRHYQLPTNWSSSSDMLMVVLWRQRVTLSRHVFPPANSAAIDARKWSIFARRVERVENIVAVLLQEIGVLILSQCHLPVRQYLSLSPSLSDDSTYQPSTSLGIDGTQPVHLPRERGRQLRAGAVGIHDSLFNR